MIRVINKFITIGLLILFAFLTACSFQYEKTSSILPDKDVIQKRPHLKILQEYDNNKEYNELYQYLEQLSTKELLEAIAEYAEYCAENDEKFEPLAFVPPLRNAWEGGIPCTEVAKIVKEKEYNSYFRAFILDAAREQINDEIVDAVLTVAEDNTEHDWLRRYALLWLRTPGTYEISTKKETDSDSALYRIYSDSNAPRIVKKAAITAMERTNDPNYKKIQNKRFTEILELSNQSLAGLSLGISKEEVINILGNNYQESFLDPDYIELYYKNGISVILGRNGNSEYQVIMINVITKEYKTNMGIKAGDYINNALEVYRNKYKEHISKHTNKKVIGMFEIDECIALKFNYNKDKISKETKINSITLTFIECFYL